MTEYLLTLEEVLRAKYLESRESYFDGMKGIERLDAQDIAIAKAQLAKCDIPARQREAVEMVFKRIEELWCECDFIEDLKQEILDKIGG